MKLSDLASDIDNLDSKQRLVSPPGSEVAPPYWSEICPGCTRDQSMELGYHVRIHRNKDTLGYSFAMLMGISPASD